MKLLHAIILILAIVVMMALSGCQTLDDTTYKYGNGIKNAISGASSAIACVATGGAVCATVGAVKGYIDGKQEARDKIVAKADAMLIKKMADAKARDIGVKVDNCWFLCD